MKRRILAVLLAVCCMASLLSGCSQLQALLNLMPESDDGEGTITARTVQSTPFFEGTGWFSEPTMYLYEGTEVTPNGIEIVGDTVWVFCNAAEGSGWTELAFLSFDYTDRIGTLPVRTPEKGVPVYFYPNGVDWSVTNGYDWIEISNICFYEGKYWGFVKDVGYICMDAVTLSENLKLPERTAADIPFEPINLIGTWYSVIDSYTDGAQAAEETWEFNEDGTFRVVTHIYFDSLIEAGLSELRGGFWWQEGEILSLSFCEMNSDGTPTDRPVDQVGEYLLMQGQEGPVICGETRIGLSSVQSYGKNYEESPVVKPESSKPEASKPESSKPTQSKPTNGISYKPMDGLLGTWHTFYGDTCQIWTFTMGSAGFKVDGQIPFWAEYQEGKLDKNGKLTNVSEHMVFDYGYFKNSKMYLVCGPDEYGPYDVRLEHGYLYIKADGYQPGYDYLVCYDSGWPPKPEQEESSKPVESSKPSADTAKHALPSGAAGTWIFENASGDGEDVLRETWIFDEAEDNSSKINGYISFTATYIAQLYDGNGVLVRMLHHGTFEFCDLQDGKFYFSDGPDVYGPYTIKIQNGELLIKAFQYQGSPTERYFRRG